MLGIWPREGAVVGPHIEGVAYTTADTGITLTD
jgi:hypothetical protein